MKPFGRALLVTAMTFYLGACDLFDSFTEMNAQLEKVTATQKKELGAEPTYSWNISNGELVHLTVQMAPVADADKPLAYFLKTTAAAVSANVKRKPTVLYVAFAVSD